MLALCGAGCAEPQPHLLHGAGLGVPAVAPRPAEVPAEPYVDVGPPVPEALSRRKRRRRKKTFHFLASPYGSEYTPARADTEVWKNAQGPVPEEAKVGELTVLGKGRGGGS